MSQAAIQSDLNNIATQQVPLSAQFNDDGYGVFFEPGTYGSAADPLVFEVGYYTEVAGLGAVPQDTTINGADRGLPQRPGLRQFHQLLGQLHRQLLAVDVQPHAERHGLGQ